MTKKRKPRPPPSPTPWPCVILAVDPANNSGWSIWANGRYVSSGECGLVLADIRRVVAGALQFAEMASGPCVLVLERPFGQARGKAYGAQGAGRGEWRMVWRDCGGVAKRVVHVWPATWRSQVLGKGMGNAKRDVARAAEKQAAIAFVTAVDPPDDWACGDDEGAAVCIGRWAVNAGEVGAVLPKSVRNG